MSTRRSARIRRQGAASALAASLLLSVMGCADSPKPASTDPTGGTGNSSPAATAGTQETACSDSAGDGGEADLTSVSIRADGGGVQITWTTSQAVRDIIDMSSDVTFLVQVTSADFSRSYPLVVSASDRNGDIPTVSNGSKSDGSSDGAAQIADSAITATLPADALSLLGKRWMWYAVTRIENIEVDRCPDDAGGAPYPPQVTAGA